MSELTSTLSWNYVRQSVPDDSITVIVAFEGGDTAHGYFETSTNKWRSMEGLCFDEEVYFWADCPEAPQLTSLPAESQSQISDSKGGAL